MSAPLPSRISRRFAALSKAVSRTLRDPMSTASALRQRRGGEFTEILEPRRLLTTLVGGDSFEYTSPDPANPAQRITNRIILTGNITAELIGGTIDPITNQVVISDVPGAFNQSQIRGLGNFSNIPQAPILGGVGGGSGTQPVTGTATNPGGMTINSPAPFNPQGQVNYAGGSAAFNMRNFAVAADGQYYGINVVKIGTQGQAGEQSIIQLVRISADGRNATVIAELNGRISAATTNSNFVDGNGVDSITAAAFDPISGRLFFVVRGNNRGAFTPPAGQPTITPLATQQLFSLAVTAGSTPAQILGSVQAIPGSFGRSSTVDTIVNAITFDRVGDVSRPVGFVVQANGGGLFDVNLTNTNIFNNFVSVTNGLRDANNNLINLTAITGLGFISDNADARDTQVYAVESAAQGTALGTAAPTLASATVGPQVLLINRDNGGAQQLGPLAAQATAGTNTVNLGLDVQSLAFDPFRRNPFTGQRGVLMGIDNTVDALVFIESRNRLPNVGAFSLYIASSDSSASVVIGQVAAFNPAEPLAARPMQPFTGSAGTLRVTSANGTGIINLTSPAGVGGVFLGLKTSGNANADQNNIPVITGQLATALGVRGAGTVTAGVFTSASLLSSLTNQGNLSDRLIGNNVSDVNGLVVNNAGQIFVVDSDGINADGNPYDGDQLYQIDRNTGLAVGSPINIVDNTTAATPLTNNRGVTLADNPERILAIFLQRLSEDGGQQSDNQNALPGSLNLGIENAQALSLSISGSGPTGFILAQTPTQRLLYSFTRVGSGNVTFTRLGPIVDADGNTISAAQALGVNSTGQLFTVGYPQGNPVPSQPVGGTPINVASVNARNLTYAADGNIYLLGFAGGNFTIQQVQRNLTGPNQGAVTGLGASFVINTAGSSVQGLNDLTNDPAGGNGLIGIGSSSVSLLPTRNVGALTDSNSNSNFVYRGLTRLARDQVFALTFNGSTLNLRNVGLTGTAQLQTVDRTFNVIPSTPRTTPDNIPGTDVRTDANPASGRGVTTAVLGIQSLTRRPGDASGIYAVGYGANALIPTTPVLGDLGDFNVRQISMSQFAPTYNFPDASYTTPAIPAGSTLAYQFTGFFRGSRDTATGGLLSGGGTSVTIQAVGANPPPPNSPPPPIPQSGGTPAVEAVFGSPPFPGVPNPAVPPFNIMTVANGIVDIRANATNRLGTVGYFTTGFNIDSPVPAAPIPGNLGGFFGVDPASGESNLRAMAFAEGVTGGLEDAYVAYFNGIGTDIYRMQRNTVTGAISSFTKISGGQDVANDDPGLRDPFNLDTEGDPAIINFVYSFWRDITVPNQYFLMGSPTPTATGAPQFIYTLTINGGAVTVTNSIALQDQDGPFAGPMGPGPIAGVVGKAGAVNAAGQVFVVIDGDLGTPGIDIGLIPNSPFYLVDPATGLMSFFGNVGAGTFASAIPAALDPTAVPPPTQANWTVENSDIRAMQFHTDTDGREMLVLLDRGTTTASGPRLIEMDLNNTFRDASIPAVVPGGVPSGMAGVPAPIVPAAVAFQSSLTGIIEDNLTTFAMDQYGRGYGVRAGSSVANPDRIIVSPNELFFQEPALTSVDGDLWSGENVRIGWLVNDDGTAFMDSITTMAADLGASRLVAVARNLLDSSLRPNDPNENIDRLVAFAVPGGTVTPTVNANGGGNRNLITVTPVRRSTAPTDTGIITINGTGTAVGVASNIQGLAFDVEGSLIGLDITATNGGRLVGLGLEPSTSTSGPRFGNPTFGAFTLTDELSTPFGSTDPRGLSSDIFGRFYTADGTSVGSPTRTQLQVSSNTVSLFRIDSATGVATRFVDLADGAQLIQQPVLSRFGGIAFQDASTLYMVQKDLRSGAFFIDANGVAVGIDRLVTATIPATATGATVAFNRVNSQTAGAIQVGNTVVPPGASNGIPTGITAMDFSSNGQLIALDNAPRIDTVNNVLLAPVNRLVRIEIDPTNPLAPSNSAYVSDDNAAAGLQGLAAFNTQFASIQTIGSPDTLRFSNNDLSLYGINPATGEATSRGNVVVTATGASITDELPVQSLATDPVSGLIFAILRGTDGANNPADFLYTINAVSGAATLLGQVQIVRNAAGVSQTAANSRLVNIEFSGERDAAGLPVLLGVNDTGSGRQLVRVNYTNVGQSEVVRGSEPGDVPATQIGFVSDVGDSDPLRSPPANRGRFYSLDLTVPQGAVLQVTPTQIYRYGNQLTIPTGTTYRAGTNAAFGTVATLQAPNGQPVLDTIRALEFNSSNALFGVRESALGVSTLVTFPSLPVAVNQPTTPVLGLSGGQQIVVASSSPVPLAGFPAPAGITAPESALVQSMFFLGSGVLRAVDISQGAPRLIDINLNAPSFSVARTDPGVPDAVLIGGDVFGGVSFYLDTTNNNAVQILPDTNGDGAIISIPGGGGGGGTGPQPTLGVPVLGEINRTTGVFTPINNSRSGQLDASITDVKAIAFDRVGTSGRTSAGLFVIDQNDRLLQIDIATGNILRVVGTVRDAFTGSVLNIGSLTFDANGRLLGQDVNNARLVDISIVTAVAGALVATPSGSLPPTVGAIGFDATGNRFLGVDNATGINAQAPGFDTSSQLKQFSTEGGSSSFSSVRSDVGSIVIGGTVAGEVEISGSVGRFYAGWIITGRVQGLGISQANPTPNNFRVLGDLNELITVAPIGTAGIAADPLQTLYRSGTDISVSGRIGVIRATGDILATIRAENTRNATSLPLVQNEIERKFVATNSTLAEATGREFALGNLQSALLTNDTSATAERIRFGSNPNGSPSGAVTVNGVLEATAQGSNDTLDFYALPLIAGQSFNINLGGNVGIGIFDPDGRLVMTNYSLSTTGTGGAGTYRVTADRPGEYRIVISRFGDVNFDGVQSAGERVQPPGTFFYAFAITGAGDLGISAVTSTGTIFDASNGILGNNFGFSSIYTASGDIGAVAATLIASNDSQSSNTVRADGDGNIRSISAGTIGLVRNGLLVGGVNVSAGGSVGLIQSTTGQLLVNTNISPSLSTGGTNANFNPEIARVGGSVQVVSAAGTFYGNLLANRGLGNLRAGNMATTIPSYINVNADNVGNDGIIDLIDVQGDLGTLQGGGAVIYTNSGGNIRYIRAGGSVFRDQGFGGGAVSEIGLDAGTELSFTDDSGTKISVEFDEQVLVPNPAFDPQNPTSPRFLNPPQIAYLPYPVRSGGSVMMALQVSQLGTAANFNFDKPNLKITSSGGSGAAEIGLLILRGDSSPVVVADGTVTQTGTVSGDGGRRITVQVEGSSRLDILSLNTNDATTHITSFKNSTGGELLELDANTFGTLSFSGDIGIARAGRNLVPVIPIVRTADVYPFELQQNTIAFASHVVRIESGSAIGNILVNGSAGSIQANNGGNDNPAVFEGIAGPLVFLGDFVSRIGIGEGLAHAGTGRVAGGVIYGTALIGEIGGSGDLLGHVVSSTGIDRIAVSGTITNALIAVLAPIARDGSPFLGFSPLYSVSGRVLPGGGGNLNSPEFEIGTVRAGAGIIGTQIQAIDIGTVSGGGFGILNTVIDSAGGGVLNTVVADGYGLRGVTIDGFSRVGRISATGNGSTLSTNSVSTSVRKSEFETIDPATGLPLTSGNDIHFFLSTSAATPVIAGITTTGVIEDLTASGNNNLGSIAGFTIRGSNPGITNSGLFFGGSIGSITTRSTIDGLTIRAGSIGTFAPGSDVLALDMTVAGSLRTLNIKGDLASNSRINLSGNSSSLGTMKVKGNFDGSLLVSGRVNSISIGGNLSNGDGSNPAISISPPPGFRGNALGKLSVGGSITGNVAIGGNVGSITAPGSFGVSGNTFAITGNLSSLNVGTNRKLPPGQQMAMNVTVTGTIGTISVRGRMTGAVTATGSIRTIRVQSDGDANRTLIAGDIVSTAGDIQTVTVTNGDIGANIRAFNTLRTVTVNNGSVLGGATLAATASSVGNITVKKGNFVGSILSGDTGAAGLRSIGNVSVDGQLGDGTAAYSIRGASLKQLKVGRSIFSSSDVSVDEVSVTGTLSTLNVGGDINSGVVIRAGAISSQKIGGENNGEIIVG